MKTIAELMELLEAKKCRSAWSKGVNIYALELLENIDENDNFELYGSPADRKMLLNGASDWSEYSYGGCSLIYDRDIAERLCSPSELKSRRGGEWQPSKRETWLDCQARALYQANSRIWNMCK